MIHEQYTQVVSLAAPFEMAQISLQGRILRTVMSA